MVKRNSVLPVMMGSLAKPVNLVSGSLQNVMRRGSRVNLQAIVAVAEEIQKNHEENDVPIEDNAISVSSQGGGPESDFGNRKRVTPESKVCRTYDKGSVVKPPSVNEEYLMRAYGWGVPGGADAGTHTNPVHLDLPPDPLDIQSLRIAMRESNAVGASAAVAAQRATVAAATAAKGSDRMPQDLPLHRREHALGMALAGQMANNKNIKSGLPHNSPSKSSPTPLLGGPAPEDFVSTDVRGGVPGNNTPYSNSDRYNVERSHLLGSRKSSNIYSIEVVSTPGMPPTPHSYISGAKGGISGDCRKEEGRGVTTQPDMRMERTGDVTTQPPCGAGLTAAPDGMETAPGSATVGGEYRIRIASGGEIDGEYQIAAGDGNGARMTTNHEEPAPVDRLAQQHSGDEGVALGDSSNQPVTVTSSSRRRLGEGAYDGGGGVEEEKWGDGDGGGGVIVSQVGVVGVERGGGAVCSESVQRSPEEQQQQQHSQQQQQRQQQPQQQQPQQQQQQQAEKQQQPRHQPPPQDKEEEEGGGLPAVVLGRRRSWLCTKEGQQWLGGIAGVVAKARAVSSDSIQRRHQEEEEEEEPGVIEAAKKSKQQQPRLQDKKEEEAAEAGGGGGGVTTVLGRRRSWLYTKEGQQWMGGVAGVVAKARARNKSCEERRQKNYQNY